MPEMTPEEAEKFEREHPLGTIFIFNPKLTDDYRKQLKQKSQAAKEASTKKQPTPKE